MPTKEERIEIARELRNAAAYGGPHYAEEFRDDLRQIIDPYNMTGTHGQLFEILADLIEPEHRKCEHCGEVYYPRTKEQRYCSKQCKKDHYVSERLRNEGEVPEYIAKVYGLETDDD